MVKNTWLLKDNFLRKNVPERALMFVLQENINFPAFEEKIAFESKQHIEYKLHDLCMKTSNDRNRGN